MTRICSRTALETSIDTGSMQVDLEPDFFVPNGSAPPVSLAKTL